MVTRGSFKLEGFKELDAALAELPASLARGASKRAVAKASRIMADEQQALANAGLKDTITVSTKARNLTGLAEFGAVRGAGGSAREAVQALRAARREGGSAGTRITSRVGSTSPLAHLFEFGTVARTQTTTGRYTGIMPAEPFIRPAFDNRAQESVGAIRTELAAEIEKTRARLAKKTARAAARASAAGG